MNGQEGTGDVLGEKGLSLLADLVAPVEIPLQVAVLLGDRTAARRVGQGDDRMPLRRRAAANDSAVASAATEPANAMPKWFQNVAAGLPAGMRQPRSAPPRGQ